MQRYEVSFEVDASPKQVWSMFHPRPPKDGVLPRVLQYPGGRMEILAEGDENGQGLVRVCEFGVPRWLGTGGQARSWEVVTDVRPGEYAQYRGVCKPLWAQMQGWHTVTELPGGGTRLTFVETYHAHNALLRKAFEARVHRFISRDNENVYRTILGYLGPVRACPVTETARA